MGFGIERFQGDVDEEFICPICAGVLEDPLQAPACEHAFCRACITEWISRQPTCPVDRQPVTANQLTPVPRIIRNLLSNLCTSCDYAPHGCTAVLKLDSLASHLVECEFDPKWPMLCEAGCELVIPKDELAEHNCVRELRALLATQSNDYEQELAEHKRELALLKESMRDQKERLEVFSWASSMVRAKITCGIIDKPTDDLLRKIKGSLSQSGCPPHIIDDLVKNCQEEQWPPGIRYDISIERGHIDIIRTEKYVFKRVPGQEALLVLHCDNTHMDERMLVKPGFVLFAT